MLQSGSRLHEPYAIKTIALSGFVAGVLDLTTVVTVYAVVQHKTTAIKILQFIASGILGPKAYTLGTGSAIAGLALHFFIAFSFAAFYFFIFPLIPFLRKQPIISGLLYGLFAWIVMNLIVVPASYVHRGPLTVQGVAIGVVILMLMIGLPVSLITKRNYERSLG